MPPTLFRFPFLLNVLEITIWEFGSIFKRRKIPLAGVKRDQSSENPGQQKGKELVGKGGQPALFGGARETFERYVVSSREGGH